MSDKDEKTYIFNPEEAAELARLSRQGEYFTKAIGDLFPPPIDPDAINTVLDIGSGPGSWSIDVAATYPQIHVFGIDVSQQMIEYSQAQAQIRKIPNVVFRKMNALSAPLDFPDHSFDLVNIRFSVSFVPAPSWPAFLAECKRLLKPGGKLCITEGDLGQSNSRAWGQILLWLAQAMAFRGLGFGKGFTIGIFAVLNKLLRDAGYTDIQSIPYFVETSYDSDYYDIWFEDGLLVARQVRPLVVGPLGVKAELYDATLQQMIEDLKQPDYCGACMLLTVVGTAHP